MEKDENLILTLDISSNSIKIGLVSEQLKIKLHKTQKLKIYNEDLDGFAKRFDMDDLWKKVIMGMDFVLSKSKNKRIVGLSTCTQRIASVFLDEKGNVLYGGPNIDIRGIDSAYLIDDAFSERDLFEITGHSPSLLFCLARLLWFKEEAEEVYAKIKKVLTLDDWLVYKFTGNFYSDLSSAGESQILDIKKGEWSSEIIDTFNFDPDFFPEIVDSGTIVGELKENLSDRFDNDLKRIPIVKTGGDTQATLLGMGVIEEGDLGISLGTTSPLQLVVNKPIFDPNCNFWTSCHSIKGKWLLESNAGNTGASYNWFKEAFLSSFTDNPDSLVEDYLKRTKPGTFSTYTYLGPEKMNIKNTTSIKRGPPIMVSEDVPKIENFARSVLENIGFGIFENHQVLRNQTDLSTKTFVAGGMAKSNEFCKLLANILGNQISVASIRESAFIGTAINTLIGLKYYSNYKSIISNLLAFEDIKNDPTVSDKFKTIYLDWKNLKSKIDSL
ncbi:MAG: FGGY-family carbohydrate kinase [Promethearchaeota archaeon]